MSYEGYVVELARRKLREVRNGELLQRLAKRRTADEMFFEFSRMRGLNVAERQAAREKVG